MATATNPKNRKSRSKKAATETTEENEVMTATETPIEDVPTETPVEGAPEVTVEEEQGPKISEAEAAEIALNEAVDVLYEGITKFAADGDTAALQESYRGIHANRRGKAQGVAMKRAMTDGNVDMEVLGKVLDAFNNLPTVSRPARTKPKIDDETAAAIQLTGLMQAFEALRVELGEEAYEKANEFFANPPEDHAARIERVANSVAKASTKGIRGGGGGGRTSYKESIADLVERGALVPGQVLKGANDVEAIVTEDGKLSVADEEFTSPSGAARAHRVDRDGKQTSINGWDFWQTEEGASIGSLREQ